MKLQPNADEIIEILASEEGDTPLDQDALLAAYMRSYGMKTITITQSRADFDRSLPDTEKGENDA